MPSDYLNLYFIQCTLCLHYLMSFIFTQTAVLRAYIITYTITCLNFYTGHV